jgi:hypothetical protein
MSEVGIIMVMFTFCEVFGKSEEWRRDILRSAEDLGVIPEKAMKGDKNSHQARYVGAKRF